MNDLDPGSSSEKTNINKTKKKWITILFINFVVFCLLILLAGIGGEIYYRFFYDTSDSFALTKNAQRWFDRHYQRNNFGIRDNIEYVKDVSPGKRRIAFIGDSFTEGHGVADVNKRFANIVRERHKNDWEVLVLAMGGFETESEISTLDLWKGYIKDVVILVYCLNDINDLVSDSKKIHDDIRQGMKFQNFLVKHSFFINMFYYRLRAILNPNISNYYEFVKTAYASSAWETQQNRLSSLSALAKERNIQLLVVTFPFLNALGKNYEYKQIHEQLNVFWEKLGVPHLDLLPLFKDQNPKSVTVGSFDAHPNEYAHGLAANAINVFIENNIHLKSMK